MPLLTKKEKEKDLIAVRDFLNELDFAAALLPDGPWADQKGLILLLPTDAEMDWKEDELPEDAPYAAAYLMQLDQEEENQMTKYLLFYFMLPQKIEDRVAGQALELVNRMNQQIRMGCFYLGKDQVSEEKCIQYRLTVGNAADAPWDEGVIGEALIEMGLYYDLMLEEAGKLYQGS